MAALTPVSYSKPLHGQPAQPREHDRLRAFENLVDLLRGLAEYFWLVEAVGHEPTQSDGSGPQVPRHQD